MLFLEKYLIYNLFEYFVPDVYSINYYEYCDNSVRIFYNEKEKEVIYSTSCIKIFLNDNKIIVVKSNKILILDLYDLHIISQHRIKAFFVTE